MSGKWGRSAELQVPRTHGAIAWPPSSPCHCCWSALWPVLPVCCPIWEHKFVLPWNGCFWTPAGRGASDLCFTWEDTFCCQFMQRCSQWLQSDSSVTSIGRLNGLGIRDWTPGDMTSVQSLSLRNTPFPPGNSTCTTFWTVLWFLRSGWVFFFNYYGWRDMVEGNEKIWDKKGSELKLHCWYSS